jgi:hypothetical protein
MDSFSQLGRSYDTDMVILRTLFALNPNTNLPISTNFIVTTDGLGGLTWMNPFENLSTAGPGIGYLPSTILNLTSNLSSLSSTVSTIGINYQAGLSSLSTVLGTAYISSGIYDFQLNSTVQGLGSSDYISTLSLISTTEGITRNYQTSGFLSSLNLLSTTGGLQREFFTAGFISTPQITSTVIGLGTVGYVSTSYLQSSLLGISTTIASTLQSTVVGLGSSGYISTAQLHSTVVGLGSSDYISTASLLSTVSSIFSPETYVSTGALISTAAGLSTNFAQAIFIDNAGNITINGGNISFSSVNNVVYLSSFVFSSITYAGTNGTVNAFTYDGTPPRSMFFSSALLNLDHFSSYITPNSRVYLDYYPTFVFSGIYQGASGYLMRGMSSFLQYGTGNFLTENQTTSWVYGNNTSNAFGNLYQQPLKLQIPGSVIAGNYANPYIFCHNMVSSLTFDTTTGFKNCNIDIRVGSTNSVFLSIQNLP